MSAQDDMNPLVGKSAPTLSLTVDDGAGRGSTITCRRVVTLLGAREGCKITLKHPHVDPVHVALVHTGTEIFAVDLVTRRRALLNDLKLSHERVSDGDRLAVFPWEFRVAIGAPADGGDGDLHTFGLEPSPRLVALEHVDSGRIMQPNREVCIIGRRHGCDIVIADNRVSRVHALLLNYFGHPAIFDLLTSNGTLVNDLPVQFHVLEDGDTVTIGESSFRARLVGSSVGEAPPVEDVPDAKLAVETTVALTAEGRSGDLIDIHATESSQRWRIADQASRLARGA